MKRIRLKSALTVLACFYFAAITLASASAESSGKTTSRNALREIESFTHWNVSDNTSNFLRNPWNYCWPPDAKGDRYSYTATLLDNAETTIHLDNRVANRASNRLRRRILNYLHKAGWRSQATGCYERDGAFIQVLEVCNRCSNFTKAPEDGVMVFVISPDN